MEIKVEVLIKAPELVEAINNLAMALCKKMPENTSESNPSVLKTPVAPVSNIQTTPASVPVAPAPQYTIEQIMKAGASLMDAGKIAELRNLIKSFNVEAVTNLKPEQYGAFATELRKLGAMI